MIFKKKNKMENEFISTGHITLGNKTIYFDLTKMSPGMKVLYNGTLRIFPISHMIELLDEWIEINGETIDLDS